MDIELLNFTEEEECQIIRSREKYFVVQALSEEIVFLQSFLKQQERQIQDYCDNFEKYVEEVEAEREHWDGYNEPEIVVFTERHVDGILESEFDIKGVFTEVLPVYQRQSMLVTLWSRFEAKDKDVVIYLNEERSTKIRKKPKDSSILRHLLTELSSFGLDFSDKKLQEAISFLDDEARFVRNCWVHDGGLPTKHQIGKIIERSSSLSITDRLIDVSNSYLHEVAGSMSLLASYVYHEIGIKRRC